MQNIYPLSFKAAIIEKKNKPLAIKTISFNGPLRIGQVLVKLRFTGICGKQIEEISGLDGNDPYIPHLLGHEGSGFVVDIGKGVEGWNVGDKAAINPNGNICGECEQCRQGYPNLCFTGVRVRAIGVQRDGGMANLVSLPMQILNKLPDTVSTLQGAWVEPLATVVRGVRVSGVTVGSSTLIIGAGPIGLLAVQTLKNTGVGNIIVVEPSAFRREKAKTLGADIVLDPLKENITEMKSACETIENLSLLKIVSIGAGASSIGLIFIYVFINRSLFGKNRFFQIKVFNHK